jgi:hypothetical protein
MASIGSALDWLLGLGRWRVVCPTCKGTGLCQKEGSLHPHSCCGGCGRKRVPWSSVPPDFDGKSHAIHRRIFPEGPLIGVGWVEGSFWQGLQQGFYYGD